MPRGVKSSARMETSSGFHCSSPRQAIWKDRQSREFIDCQPRQPIGLAEDDAAGIGKAQRLPRVPRRLDPAGKKRAVDWLCLVPRQNADGEPGVAN